MSRSGRPAACEACAALERFARDLFLTRGRAQTPSENALLRDVFHGRATATRWFAVDRLARDALRAPRALASAGPARRRLARFLADSPTTGNPAPKSHLREVAGTRASAAS